MDAKIGIDSAWMPWFTWEIALREFGPEAGGGDESTGCQVVGMGVDWMRSEEPAGPSLAYHSGQPGSGRECGPQPSVGEPQVFPPVDAEGGRSRCGFSCPNVGRTQRGGFAIGKIKNSHAETFSQHADNRAPHAKFGVVGVGGDDQYVKHDTEQSNGEWTAGGADLGGSYSVPKSSG